MNIDYLSTENAHKRDEDIVFDEGPHIYTICGDAKYMSVTTFNHSQFEKFDSSKIIAAFFLLTKMDILSYSETNVW